MSKLAARALTLLCGLLLVTASASAETVHLNTGESLQGRIVRVDAETISLESDRGFGVIQIARSDITLIEFDAAKRDLTRFMGVGYYHRATPSSVGAQAAEYGVDALALKFWLDTETAAEVLVGFYSADDANGTLFRVFSLDGRYSKVFQRRGLLDIYYGGSLGYMNVSDHTLGRNLDATGFGLRGFLGAEIFFASLPNLGISAELSLGTQTVGGAGVTNLSATTFPALSMRYYY